MMSKSILTSSFSSKSFFLYHPEILLRHSKLQGEKTKPVPCWEQRGLQHPLQNKDVASTSSGKSQNMANF